MVSRDFRPQRWLAGCQVEFVWQRGIGRCGAVEVTEARWMIEQVTNNQAMVLLWGVVESYLKNEEVSTRFRS